VPSFLFNFFSGIEFLSTILSLRSQRKRHSTPGTYPISNKLYHRAVLPTHVAPSQT